MFKIFCCDNGVDFAVRSVASCNVSRTLSVQVSSRLHIARYDMRLNMNDESEEVKNEANITQLNK